jgi:hypothetical protein
MFVRYGGSCILNCLEFMQILCAFACHYSYKELGNANADKKNDKKKNTESDLNFSISKTSWWMASFGGRTAKRHKAIGNTLKLSVIRSGKLKRGLNKSDTTREYVDARGKRCYSGTKTLKQTQQLGTRTTEGLRALLQFPYISSLGPKRAPSKINPPLSHPCHPIEYETKEQLSMSKALSCLVWHALAALASRTCWYAHGCARVGC